MSQKKQRWFTCTPVDFGGGPDFFSRDSGLLCRGFQKIGIDSFAVMPGSPRPDDEPDLIRTEFANLESAEWWRSHQLDGVILYAWGRPKLRRVARAIRESGTLLVLNQDSSGNISPLNGLKAWMIERWTLTGSGASPAMALRGALHILNGLTLGILRIDLLRAIHLRQGHFIACVFPDATENYRRLCRVYGGKALAEKVVLLPHAVSPSLRYNPATHQKQPSIIAIGRWNAEIQKRPSLLTETIGRLLSENPIISVNIVGTYTPQIEAWRNQLPDPQRVVLHGKLPHEKLTELLATAQIYFCPSAYESFNIAAAEALCCGCSVVAPARPTMASFRWFVSHDSGRLAASDDANGLLRALLDEISLWEKGGRDPLAISDHWTSILHADKVASNVLRHAAKKYLQSP